ncbi:MAG: hypothetical protein EXS05_11955 [Planctomycetaceae bacterium]|nr:hypothetical protein [Planctomycetaceae bacterium]
MRIAELGSGIGRLRDAVETLEAAWQQTQHDWTDENSRNIYENHLKPMLIEVTSAYAAIQLLADELAKAERECEPW